MKYFPVDRLKPSIGLMKRVSTAVGPNICVKLPFVAFELPEIEELGLVTTCLVLDFINLPSADPASLIDQQFRFPLNPTKGYIDASIYINHAHHPVNISMLRFGPLLEGTVGLEIELEFIFEHEGLGDFRNTVWRFQTGVSG